LGRFAAIRAEPSSAGTLTLTPSYETLLLTPYHLQFTTLLLIPMVFDDHDQHAEDEGEEDGDDGKYTAVIEAVRFCGVFRH
jgi:hypothetical protein